ncbi:MAG: hypothetical protein ACI82G_002046 [Bradymonadia bacterium]|jgi:hypothetical protein
MVRMLRLPLCALVLSLVAGAAFSVQAQELTAPEERERLSGSFELQNVRLRGMAGAFAGGGSGTGAVYSNPAGIVTAAIYAFEVSYQHELESDGNAIGVTLVDSKTNGALAAGMGYSFGFSPGESGGANDNVRDHDLRAVLAVPLIPQSLAIGVGGHYYIRSRGQVPVVDGENLEISQRGLSFDVGIMAVPAEVLTIGIVARNLLTVDNMMDVRRGVGAGVGIYAGNLHIEAEYIGEYLASRRDGEGNQLSEGVWGSGAAVGLEYVANTVPIRLGYRNDAHDDQNGLVAVGLGVRSPTFGADIAFEQSLDDTSNRTFSLSFAGFF